MNTKVDYLESLQFKLKSAEYHYEQAFSIVNDAPYDEKLLIACTSEFIAMMLTLQSCLDILGQLINEKKKLQLPADRLYFGDVIKEVNQKFKGSSLTKKINELKQVSYYLRDFCNVTKHRNIIKVSEQGAFINPSMVVVYLVIEGFTRNNRSYKEKMLDSTMTLIFTQMTDKINDIINLNNAR